MDSFSVGEVAILCGSRVYPEYNEMDCLIIESCGPHFGYSYLERRDIWADTYTVRCVDGKEFYVKPRNLRKKRPPEEYDGNQITKWDDCPFKPKEMVRA